MKLDDIKRLSDTEKKLSDTEKKEIYDSGKCKIDMVFAEKLEDLHRNSARKIEQLEAKRLYEIKKLHDDIFGIESETE